MPKTLRLTAPDQKTSDREIETAIRIILRTAKADRVLAIRRNLRTIRDEGDDLPDEQTARFLMMMAHEHVSEETWRGLLAEFAKGG